MRVLVVAAFAIGVAAGLRPPVGSPPAYKDKNSVGAASVAFSFAPPLTLSKWETMQAKRCKLVVRYGCAEDGANALEATYARTRELIQARFPDVIVEGEWTPRDGGDDSFSFVIEVDGRVAYEKPRERSGVYLSMRVLEREINRARKARRPMSAYGDPDAPRGGRRSAPRRDPADVPKYA